MTPIDMSAFTRAMRSSGVAEPSGRVSARKDPTPATAKGVRSYGVRKDFLKFATVLDENRDKFKNIDLNHGVPLLVRKWQMQNGGLLAKALRESGLTMKQLVSKLRRMEKDGTQRRQSWLTNRTHPAWAGSNEAGWAPHKNWRLPIDRRIRHSPVDEKRVAFHRTHDVKREPEKYLDFRQTSSLLGIVARTACVCGKTPLLPPFFVQLLFPNEETEEWKESGYPYSDDGAGLITHLTTYPESNYGTMNGSGCLPFWCRSMVGIISTPSIFGSRYNGVAGNSCQWPSARNLTLIKAIPSKGSLGRNRNLREIFLSGQIVSHMFPQCCWPDREWVEKSFSASVTGVGEDGALTPPAVRYANFCVGLAPHGVFDQARKGLKSPEGWGASTLVGPNITMRNLERCLGIHQEFEGDENAVRLAQRFRDLTLGQAIMSFTKVDQLIAVATGAAYYPE